MIILFKLLVKGKNGEIYNVGNPNPELGIVDLAKKVCKVVDKDIEVEITEYPDFYPSDEPLRRCPDVSKAKSCIDYEAQVPLEEGIKRMFEYYKNKK